jgi:hypothetical protein
MTREGSNDATRFGRGLDRRAFIAVGGGVGATLLAGCTSEGPSDGNGDAPDGSGGTDTPTGGAASFRLLVSDAPADIDDFDRLDVTFSRARVFEGTDDEGTETDDDESTGTEEADDDATETQATETPQTASEPVEEDQQQTSDDTATESGTATETDDGTETDDESETDESEDDDGDSDDDGTETDDGGSDDEDERGFSVIELDSPTVDLTQVVGDVAQPIFDGELEAGSYRKLELHVEDVEGIVDGESVEVMVPSGKLQLTKPFEVRAGEELDFVFDINVVKRGKQASYNLKPVISQSGVRGTDVEVEEVGEDDDDDNDDDGNEDDGDGDDEKEDETDDDSNDEAETDDDENDDDRGGNESAA